MPPHNSTRFPFALPSPPSNSTAYLPASRPIRTLSPPINWVYLSVSTFRSRMITGILASIALSTTPVNPADSFGLTNRMSTPCRIRFSTSATCFSVLSCPSVIINSSSGCLAASLIISLLNCTRHGSTVVTWEKPNRYFFDSAREYNGLNTVVAAAATTVVLINVLLFIGGITTVNIYLYLLSITEYFTNSVIKSRIPVRLGNLPHFLDLAGLSNYFPAMFLHLQIGPDLFPQHPELTFLQQYRNQNYHSLQN